MHSVRSKAEALKAKLCSAGGETLVEVLAALLLSSLSLLMLAMAVSVSVRLSSLSADSTTRYYEATDVLAAGASASGSAGSGTVAVTANSAGFTGGSVDVDYVEQDILGGTTGVSYEQAG